MGAVIFAPRVWASFSCSFSSRDIASLTTLPALTIVVSSALP